MEHVFPDAKFEIRIDEDELLSTRRVVFIRLKYNCPCYDVRPPQMSEYIKVCGTPEVMITDAIRAMIDYGVNPDCKHYFLTGFTKDTEVQFTAVFDL